MQICEKLSLLDSRPHRAYFFVLWMVFAFGFLPSCLAQRSGRCDGEQEIHKWSKCVECSLNALMSCSSGYQRLTKGEGSKRCSFRAYFGFRFGFVTLRGCQHLCAKKIKIKECCDGFWGPDCQACPGQTPCSGAGSCSQRVTGNGTCTCRAGFRGTACELCTNPERFGPKCSQVCSCQHGTCDSGVLGSGSCLPNSCHLGYTGSNCEKRRPSCDQNVTCGLASHCFKLNGSDTCVCDPGFKGDGQICSAINPCRDEIHSCHANAKCVFTKPGRHDCTCPDGYYGDGTFCVVIDPCQRNSGGCPANSTVCNFNGPGKSNCSCLPGFQNYVSGVGCAKIDLCNDGKNGGCDINAVCVNDRPAIKGCVCKNGYRGNGTACFGDIVMRVNELQLSGPPDIRGQLGNAVSILKHSLERPLAGAGPFTFFMMVDKAFSPFTPQQVAHLIADADLAARLARLHVVAGDLDSFELKNAGRVTTLQGTNATVTVTNGKMFYKVDGQVNNATVLYSDLLAANGMIHIVDKIMLQPGSYSSTVAKTTRQIIDSKPELSLFAKLLQTSGRALELIHPNRASVTVFAPVNSAFSKVVDNATIHYLTSTDKGRKKLTIFLKSHVLPNMIEITDLIYKSNVSSIEQDSSTVQLKPHGQLVIAGNVHVIDANILATDGVIHEVDNLLIPDSIQPLMPRFCHKEIKTKGMCYRCDMIDALPRKGCERGTTPSDTQRGCRYRLRLRGFRLGTFRGCQTFPCKREEPECCEGYFGKECHPCPGPFDNPCYNHGKCSDKISGNGACTCYPNFKGTACELCTDPQHFGAHCNQSCTCVHGACNNGPAGTGMCKPNSCLPGFHGDNCDQHNAPCQGGASLSCHINASCAFMNGVDQCLCNPGFEGSGRQCAEIDPCAQPNRGDCHHQAVCTKIGAGINNCTCIDGFEGDGIICVPVDPCTKPSRGGCHSNAECIYASPGKGLCYCKTGYSGDGIKSCREINVCLIKNGGCPTKATCHRTGPGIHTCTCNQGYVRVDNACMPTVATIIQDDSNLLGVATLLRQANLLYYLSDPKKNFTVFAPSTRGLGRLSSGDKDYWTNSTERIKYLMEYHIANTRYTTTVLGRMPAVPTLNGRSLTIVVRGIQLFIDKNATIIQPEIVAENGVVFIIDNVLLPPRLPIEKNLPEVTALLKNISEFSDFYSSLAHFNLLSSLDQCKGCTVFAPTNSAFRDYSLMQSKNVSADHMLFHVVKQVILSAAIHNGQDFTSLLGTGYHVQIIKYKSGKLKVNGAEVVGQEMRARQAVVYGISKVLEPIKSTCDQVRSRFANGPCTLCFLLVPQCRTGWTKIGTARDSCWYLFIRGCQAKCRRDITVQRCCAGFWGVGCQACPGNGSVACSGRDHGTCSDGKTGNGHCNCATNFTGTSCEKCVAGKFGKDCTGDCKCVKGVCNDGVDGDGLCTCYHGWKGKLCDSSANFNNCLPEICHTHATCRGSLGNATCDCDAGFTGNGTFCEERTACHVNNGGCDINAVCTVQTNATKSRVCKCRSGYTGDGINCLEINVCQVDNGGCHSNATCAKIGPAQRNCFCKDGFSGDGINTCIGLNPCEINNGECSVRADCKHTGSHQRTCTCKRGYIGDGFSCFGDTLEALKFDQDFTEFEYLLQKHSMRNLLSSHGQVTLVAPTNAALSKVFSVFRKRRSVPQLSPSQLEVVYLKHHILACVALRNSTLQASSINFTTVLGAQVTAVSERHELYFLDDSGARSKVTGLYEASNGFILKVNKVLIPPSVFLTPVSRKDPFIDVATKHGYTKFVQFVKAAGLEALMSNPFSEPYLMFWPTDEAVNNLPQELQNRLNNVGNLADLKEFILYHVVEQAVTNLDTTSFLRGGAGIELRTMQGSSLFVACKGEKGDIYVNGESKIIERDVPFKGGVAFGIEQLLVPLGFAGRCDEIKDINTKGPCGNCFVPVSCSPETTHAGTTAHSCQYSGGLLGCQPICLHRKREHKCCQNHYGPDCKACPGGIQSPCNRRGSCNDGLSGTGLCNCTTPYYGISCERCKGDPATCPVIGSCDNKRGGCHALATCSESATGGVNCTCRPGYEGDGYFCQMIDRCAKNNGDCGDDGDCVFRGPGQRECGCGPHLYGVWPICSSIGPSSPCATNNGGCAAHATCSLQANKVNCKCWPGFVGDGFTCEGHIIQILQETRDLTEFYKALYHLKNTRAGSALYRDLASPSQHFTVFAPSNSAVNHEKFTLDFMKNHIVSKAFPTRGVTSVTVTTLMGTKLHIKYLANGHLVVNGVAHTVAGIPATNGVVHVVDQMIPVIDVEPTPTLTPSSAAVATSPAAPNLRGKRKLEESGLGPGPIVGIILAVLSLLLLIAVVVWILRKKRPGMDPGFRYKREQDAVMCGTEGPAVLKTVSFENRLYDASLETTPYVEIIDDKKCSASDAFPVDVAYQNPMFEVDNGNGNRRAKRSVFEPQHKDFSAEFVNSANPVCHEMAEIDQAGHAKVFLSVDGQAGGEETC